MKESMGNAVADRAHDVLRPMLFPGSTMVAMMKARSDETRTQDLLSRGSDSTEVRGGRDNGARSVVSGRVPIPTPPECAHCTTARAWLPQCCGSHRGPQVGAADLPKAGVPGRCACSFEAAPRVKVVAPGRGGTNEGSKSRSALGPRRSRFRRGPRLRRIPPAAQHRSV